MKFNKWRGLLLGFLIWLVVAFISYFIGIAPPQSDWGRWIVLSIIPGFFVFGWWWERKEKKL